MATHPNRSTAEPASMARRLMRKHRLRLIEFRIGFDSVAVDALPDFHHPIVDERRAAAFEKAGGELSMGQISGLRDSFYEPIARGHGKTVDEALTSLSAALPSPPEAS